MNDFVNELFSIKVADAESFFEENKSVFETNILVFSFLKDELKRSDPTTNILLQWAFSTFYGMSHVPKDKRIYLFKKMQEIKSCHNELDAKEITESLAENMGKKYFSFVTKMLNLADDEKYPIYDKYVGRLFEKQHNKGETRLEHHMSIYQDIKNFYEGNKNHEIIKVFKEHFSSIKIGSMKILDSVFWVIGKEYYENED